MILYGSEEIEPESTDEIIHYMCPNNIQVQLNSIILSTPADGQFTLYKNGQTVVAMRLSAFNQTQQFYFGSELGLRPLDIVSVYAYHGQSSVQALGCTLLLEQL